MTNKYEYLDHTADVIVHAWGDSLTDAFANSVYGMFGYMTELEGVSESESITISLEDDLPDEEHLLYKVLDECLFTFMTQDYFLIKRIEFNRLGLSGFEAQAWGEYMDLNRHSRGTEIKAITMHGMTVGYDEGINKVDVRFLLDI